MPKYGLQSKAIFFVVVFFLFPSTLMAEEAAFYLDPIIVTASSYNEEEIRPGYYKIDGEKLAVGSYESALDVVRQLPGVTLGSMGASGGFNAYSTILLNGSDRYVVVIDGVRSNWNGSIYNDFDFSVLPADMLDSVEILPASAGAVYGQAAKGGVIKITTKKAKAGTRTSINLETGSYGREQENIFHLGKSGDWSWSVYAQKSIMGDYSSAKHNIASYDNTENADIKITKSWGDTADLTLSYSAFSGRYTSKIFRTNEAGLRDHVIVDGRKAEGNFTAEYNHKISDTENNVLGIYRRTSTAAYDDVPSDPKDRAWLIDLSTEGFFDRYSQKWHPKNTFTGGLEYYQDVVRDYQDNLSNYKDRTLISKAVYVQNEWQPDERTKVTGSLRQDYNSYAGKALSSAAAFEYKPSDKLLYTASYTEYFAPPKQLQIFAPYGSELLKPEKGKVYEAGAAYMPDSSLVLKANVFHREASNVIAIDVTTIPRRYANVAREKATGFTFSIDKSFSDMWHSSLSYTQTTVDVERQVSSLRNTMVPRGEFLFNLMYDSDKYSALLQGRSVFDQSNGRGEGLYANNTYWVWNTSLHYRINKNTKLYLKVNNIFDQFYSDYDNTSILQDGSRLPFEEWYAEPGRNYQVGINCSF